MPNASHRVLDMETGIEYRSKAAAGRALAALVGGDPRDQFVYFEIARRYPDRLRVLSESSEWVRLDDPSAPVGSLRPADPPARTPSGTRVTTLVIDEQKYGDVKELLGTSTLRETVDRSFDEVLVRGARAQSIRRLRSMEGLDLDKRSVMEKAWR